MQHLRLAGGTVIRDKLSIASERLALWWSIIQGGAKSQDEIERYLISKGFPFRLVQCTPLLCEELNARLVTAPFARPKNGPVPGLHGIPASIYQHFPNVFIAQMLNLLQGLMTGAVPPDSWTVAPVSSIRKQPVVPVEEGVRSISVCNVLLKWVTTVLLMQLEDTLHQVVPIEQKG